MSLRRQLPALSPLPAAALLGGLRGALSPDAARAAVRSRLAERFGAAEAVLTDSGTGALAHAIRCAVPEGDGPVALPAWGCYDLATAADGAGVAVVLYDLDPETLSPDRDSLERALAQGARAVVFAHYFGVPVDMRTAMATAARYGIAAIEDAAQAAGARLGGQALGTWGDYVVLSFGRGKGTTGGRGGALLTRTPAAAARAASCTVAAPARGAKELVLLGAQWLLGRPSLYALPSALPFLHLGETLYREAEPVHGMSGASAGTLRKTLRGADAEDEARRRHAARLAAAAGAGLRPVRLAPEAEPGWLRLPLWADAARRARAVAPEARALGIMPGYPRALADLEGFRRRVRNRDDGFPGARGLADHLITLPTHSRLSGADLRRLEHWLAG